MHSEMKRKVYFPFAFLSFFRNFANRIMKRTFPLLVIAGALALGITACKEKKQSDDIIVAKYVPEGPKAPIRMATDVRRTDVQWLDKSFVVVIRREAADSLPLLKDETGQQYVDNRIVLTVQRSDSSVFVRKRFTKESFASCLDADFRQHGFLESLVYHGVENQLLKFGAVVSRPGSDDEFIPLDIYFDRQGRMSMAIGKLYETANDSI
jgi:hypothetical protein